MAFGGVKVVAAEEAGTHLSALLEEVTKGEIIVISRSGKRLAKLVPYDGHGARPRVGKVMDAPFLVPEEALRPMSEPELKSSGLK
jgi:prevent-host-death family protein